MLMSLDDFDRPCLLLLINGKISRFFPWSRSVTYLPSSRVALLGFYYWNLRKNSVNPDGNNHDMQLYLI